ncbi:hypothetical protein IWW36_003831, partial [Coemansia brasiliensis]
MKITLLKNVTKRMLVVRQHAARTAVSANAACVPKDAHVINVAKSVYVTSSVNIISYTDTSLSKEVIRLTEAYSVAVSQRNADVAAANAATDRGLAIRYNNLIAARPDAGFEKIACKIQFQRQQIAWEKQKALNLQDQLKKLNEASKLAEIKAEYIHESTRLLQEKCDEVSRRHWDISQALYALLKIYNQARTERIRLSQKFY